MRSPWESGEDSEAGEHATAVLGAIKMLNGGDLHHPPKDGNVLVNRLAQVIGSTPLIALRKSEIKTSEEGDLVVALFLIATFGQAMHYVRSSVKVPESPLSLPNGGPVTTAFCTELEEWLRPHWNRLNAEAKAERAGK